MKILQTLAVFVLLVAVGRAATGGSNDRVIELPAVVVEATRISPPALDNRLTFDEIRAEASLSLRIEMRRAVGRTLRHLASDQHRASPAIFVPSAKPNV